jgi:hypothetical protein
MLKLQERKLTTQKGIEELREFLKSFEFDADVPNVKSDISFFARVDLGDSSSYNYKNCNCEFVVKRGSLKIKANIISDYGDCYEEVDYDIAIKRISFMDCIASFTSVVEKYNKEVIEVEKGIETFLNFMNDWKNK